MSDSPSQGSPNLATRSCTDCEATTKPVARLPNGWKRHNEEVYCPSCWKRRYIIKALAFPIASPLDGEWPELRAQIKNMWALTTQASNWIMTELYARDIRRDDRAKMPPMRPVYLYPEARERFPGLPAQSVAALERAAQRRYRMARYEIWACRRALPTFRYPMPFAVPSPAWSAEIENGAPVVSVRIGDRRWRLRLKGGFRFKQLGRAFEAIVSGEALKGELDIYQHPKETMVKLVAWFPRGDNGGRTEAAEDAAGALTIRTDRESLIVAADASGRTIWSYHADHVVRWAAEHRRQLERWADDTKYEHRPVPPFAERRQAACVKYRNRIRTACQQVAAAVAGYAARRHFSEVRYDDAEHGFCTEFPWYTLRQALARALDQRAIRFVAASDMASSPPDNSL